MTALEIQGQKRTTAILDRVDFDFVLSVGENDGLIMTADGLSTAT